MLLQTDCVSLVSEAETESVPSSEVILCREQEEETEEAGAQGGRDYCGFIIQKHRKGVEGGGGLTLSVIYASRLIRSGLFRSGSAGSHSQEIKSE